MHVDLLTLYLLAIGTLFASAGMMLWEHRTHPKRSKELKILAAGFATLALGCVGVAIRSRLPGTLSSAISNLVILTGYLLILHGVAALSRRRYLTVSVVLLALQALAWAASGSQWQAVMWNYATSVPIAITTALTARELLRKDTMPLAQSRPIAAAVTSIHALFYVFRAFALPWVVATLGHNAQSFASKVTMYEGVLYSVVLPMTLLKLFREEAHVELVQAAQTDYLTRLGNRRWFFEEGERVLGGNEADRSATLLAFDLDQFKAINDRYGHKAGDEVLKSFADIARGVLGPEAILARIGGEEFAALLPGHDRQSAQAIGEQVAKHFAETTAHRIHGVNIPTTVSIGLAQLGDEASTLADLLATADRALYSAKALGGNRLEVAHRTERVALM